MTTFSQEIALDQKLGAKTKVFTIPDSYSGLHHWNWSKCVARTTRLLVSDFCSKVKSFNIIPPKTFRDFFIWNDSVEVFLSFFKSLTKSLSGWWERFWSLRTSLSKTNIMFVFFCVIFCRPRKIWWINELNQV